MRVRSRSTQAPRTQPQLSCAATTHPLSRQTTKISPTRERERIPSPPQPQPRELSQTIVRMQCAHRARNDAREAQIEQTTRAPPDEMQAPSRRRDAWTPPRARAQTPRSLLHPAPRAPIARTTRVAQARRAPIPGELLVAEGHMLHFRLRGCWNCEGRVGLVYSGTYVVL